MWADLALSGGLAALRQGMSYSAAAKDADEKRAWQAYKNSMVKLSNANNQNILSVNESIVRDASADQEFQINRSAYLTTAQAEVSAAASGTGGRSVNDVMLDIDHNTAMAQAKRKSDLEAQYMQIDNQRQQSAFQAASSMDYSPIPEPNPATYMLNFATDVAKQYQRSTPGGGSRGQQIARLIDNS